MSGASARAARGRIDRAVLAEMWVAGARLSDIAARFGVHECSVSRVRAEMGLPPRVAPIDTDRLRALWRAGRTAREIAAELGASYHGVKRVAARMKLRLRSQRVPVDRARVIALHDSGASIAAIVRATGYTPGRVRRVLDTEAARRAAEVRVALGAVGVICPLSLRAQLADRWRLFVRAEFSSVTELALEYGVSPQAARNWWMGVGGPSGAALAQAALTRRAAFERYIGGVVA